MNTGQVGATVIGPHVCEATAFATGSGATGWRRRSSRDPRAVRVDVREAAVRGGGDGAPGRSCGSPGKNQGCGCGLERTRDVVDLRIRQHRDSGVLGSRGRETPHRGAALPHSGGGVLVRACACTAHGSENVRSGISSLGASGFIQRAPSGPLLSAT